MGHNTILGTGSVSLAYKLLLFVLYTPLDALPTLTTKDRDNLIRLHYQNGNTLSDLARMYGISPQRVYQIVNHKHK